jgi:hypothetical protein
MRKPSYWSGVTDFAGEVIGWVHQETLSFIALSLIETEVAGKGRVRLKTRAIQNLVNRRIRFGGKCRILV